MIKTVLRRLTRASCRQKTSVIFCTFRVFGLPKTAAKSPPPQAGLPLGRSSLDCPEEEMCSLWPLDGGQEVSSTQQLDWLPQRDKYIWPCREKTQIVEGKPLLVKVTVERKKKRRQSKYRCVWVHFQMEGSSLIRTGKAWRDTKPVGVKGKEMCV